MYEFPFGFNYSWMLLIFALTSAYAVVCPLITPFGLFYMVMKHGVDRLVYTFVNLKNPYRKYLFFRYNLYYAYKRSKISKNIHASAVNFVIISLLLQQLILLCFNIVRSQDSAPDHILSPRAIFSLIMLCFFAFFFVAQFSIHLFKGIR